jgi:hypothetical protein
MERSKTSTTVSRALQAAKKIIGKELDGIRQVAATEHSNVADEAVFYKLAVLDVCDVAGAYVVSGIFE